MVFSLNKGTELTTALLEKMINKFRVEVEPKLSKYKRYYDGEQNIKSKSYADATKPCNKAVSNAIKNVVDSYAGYLATPSYISYTSDNDIEAVMNILKYNDYQTEDSDFLQDALIYGTAAELMYIDEDAQPRFKLINPTTCFGVFDSSLTGDLTHFVRMYKEDEWSDSDTYLVDVYSDTEIKHYKMSGYLGGLELIGEEPHYFSQVPANIFSLQDEKSIFDCVIDLQDIYNTLLNAEVDDYESFVDSYLVITGADVDGSTMQIMRESRGIALPEGATASYLTKAVNDTQIENMLKRIQDSIYQISSCVDFSSDSFTGGVSSGVAIRFKLSGMETRAGKIEAAMKKALQRRVEIICGIASLKLGEEVYRDITITFKRNIPEDTAATIQLINALKGSVSDATLLAQLPFITDVNAELEKVKEQKAANMELYGFDAPTDDKEAE